MAEITLRRATSADAPALNAIHRYYVQNTVITFQFECFEDEEFRDKIAKVNAENLPFIVAEEPDGKLVGYCSSSHFRSAKLGYRHTVELSLFCHPKYQGKGIGSKLLTEQIAILRTPADYPHYVDAMPKDHEVVNLLACMAIDDATPKHGDELRDFYIKFGFEERGHLCRVGHKFGRW